jgi:hypothetical protein
MNQIYFVLRNTLQILRIALSRHLAIGLTAVIAIHQVLALADSKTSGTDLFRYRLNITCRVTKSIMHESGGMTVSTLQKSFEINPNSHGRFTLYDEELRDENANETIIKYLLELEYQPTESEVATKDGLLLLLFNNEYFGEFKLARARFEKESFEKEVSYQSPSSMLGRVASSFLGPKVKTKFKVDCDRASAGWK